MANKTIMVKFHPIATEQDVAGSTYSAQALARQYGGYMDYQFTITRAASFSIPEELADLFMNAVSSYPGVETVYESVPATVLGGDFPASEYGQMYPAMPAMYPPAFWNGYEPRAFATAGSPVVPWGVDFVNAPKVHAAGNRGQNVKVCIIDTGILSSHPDLRANFKGGHTYLHDETGSPIENNDPADDFGHGTHVAGIIGANGNIIGVAPNVEIYAVRVLKKHGCNSAQGTGADIIKGVEWAVSNGMNIISMSLGLNGHDPALHDACNNAYNAGILLVAATGNSGASSDPCDKDTISEPASYDSVIAVTAMVWDGTLAYFSSRGPKAEIAAPGYFVYSTFFQPFGKTQIYYRDWSGTSMACPHVTGAAALVWSANPHFTNVQVRQALDGGCTHLGDAGRNGCFGFGLIDCYAAAYGAAPQALPPVPAASHWTCTSNKGCVGMNGQVIDDICDQGGNCASCCAGDPFYECVVDALGKYQNFDACSRAGCSGFTYSTCVNFGGNVNKCMPAIKTDPGAMPTDQCRAQCEGGGGAQRYKCSGAPDWACSADPNGQYSDQQSCQNACKPTGGCAPLGCSIQFG